MIKIGAFPHGSTPFRDGENRKKSKENLSDWDITWGSYWDIDGKSFIVKDMGFKELFQQT